MTSIENLKKLLIIADMDDEFEEVDYHKYYQVLTGGKSVPQHLNTQAPLSNLRKTSAHLYRYARNHAVHIRLIRCAL